MLMPLESVSAAMLPHIGIANKVPALPAPQTPSLTRPQISVLALLIFPMLMLQVNVLLVLPQVSGTPTP